MSARDITAFVFIYAAFWGAVYLSGMLAGPLNNYLVLGMGVFPLVFAGKASLKKAWVVSGVNALACGAMVFLPGIMSPYFFAAAFILQAVLLLTAAPFVIHLKNISAGDKELMAKEQIFKRVKNTGIKRAREEDDSVDKEIKDIVSLYSAVKELSSSLKVEEAMEIISAILKRIIRSNFGIPLDKISFILLFRKKEGFYIAGSYGYDEETLEESGERITSSILKNSPASNGVKYESKAGGSARKGGPSFIRSVLYSPFYAEKKLLGVLFLSGAEENIFSEKQVESIKILSNQIAIAMEKVHLYDEVQKMSITDSLTGLYVHRYFQEKIENELKRTARYGESLSLVMSDIDFFKSINDTYGHLAGDYILKTIALILKNNTTAVDTVARYGGEEFVILMPGTDKENCHMKAVKIRKEIEKYNFAYKGTPIKVTMSFGVASYPSDAITRRSLVDRADKALYRAKEEGRNRALKY